jgi:hypothetical protein
MHLSVLQILPRDLNINRPEHLGQGHVVGQIPKRPEHGVGEQILTAVYGNAAIRVELSVELGKHETHHARYPLAAGAVSGSGLRCLDA